MHRSVLIAAFVIVSGPVYAQEEPTKAALDDLKKAVVANTKAVEALVAAHGRWRRAVVVQTFLPNQSLRECPTGAVRECDAVAAAMCQEIEFQSGKAIQVGAQGKKFVLTNAICTD